MKKYKDTIIQILIGAACGVAGGLCAVFLMPDIEGLGDFFWMLVSLVISFYLHIILHEGGHLVCGLLSGYKFVSFRIGSDILIKIDGKYHLKKFNIPGTGGQCLLDPPEMVDGQYPAKLYNLGGGLSNFLFSAIGFIIAQTSDARIVPIVMLPFIFIGLALGATNLIPLRIGGIANDGYNLMTLDKDPVSSKALWQQLRVNKLQSDGIRLKDMDVELFDLAQSDIEANPLVDQMKLFWLQRLMDEKRFDEADAFGKELEAGKTSIELFKNMIGVELLYLELIGPCRETEVNRRYNKTMKKWLKLVKGYPSTHRVNYAYAVRFAKDEKMASKAAAGFVKACKGYPMQGEIETEKMLFAEVEKEEI